MTPPTHMEVYLILTPPHVEFMLDFQVYSHGPESSRLIVVSRHGRR